MGNNIMSIGDTPMALPIVQSAFGDFMWTVEFLADETGETKVDVSDSDFDFVIYESDGSTPIIELDLSDGIIFIDDYSIRVRIALEDYTPLTVGCKYPYMLLQTSASGQRKPLFRASFMLTK